MGRLWLFRFGAARSTLTAVALDHADHWAARPGGSCAPIAVISRDTPARSSITAAGSCGGGAGSLRVRCLRASGARSWSVRAGACARRRLHSRRSPRSGPSAGSGQPGPFGGLATARFVARSKRNSAGAEERVACHRNREHRCGVVGRSRFVSCAVRGMRVLLSYHNRPITLDDLT